MSKRIIRNAAKCNRCGDVIESNHRHDFKACCCGRVWIDGGHEYLRHGVMDEDDFIDLSEVEVVEDG